MYSFVWTKDTEASHRSAFQTACVDLTCVCQNVKEGFRSSTGLTMCVSVWEEVFVLFRLLAALTFTSIFHVCSFQTKAECWYNLLASHRKWVFVCSLMVFLLLFLMRSSFFSTELIWSASFISLRPHIHLVARMKRGEMWQMFNIFHRHQDLGWVAQAHEGIAMTQQDSWYKFNFHYDGKWVFFSVIERKHYFHVSAHKIVCLVDLAQTASSSSVFQQMFWQRYLPCVHIGH